jgi:hydroxylamine reductase (hybrid-cluster protein)
MLPGTGLPRLLDMGQCNDAYSALVVATVRHVRWYFLCYAVFVLHRTAGTGLPRLLSQGQCNAMVHWWWPR